METTSKTRENRLRKKAARYGLTLRKSRRRDPRAIGYGRYVLIDGLGNAPAAADGMSALWWTLDQVEKLLGGAGTDPGRGEPADQAAGPRS